jgi:hypothetical protein
MIKQCDVIECFPFSTAKPELQTNEIYRGCNKAAPESSNNNNLKYHHSKMTGCIANFKGEVS